MNNMIAAADWFISELVDSDAGDIIITMDEAQAIWNDGFMTTDIIDTYDLWVSGLDEWVEMWDEIWHRSMDWVRQRRAAGNQ